MPDQLMTFHVNQPLALEVSAIPPRARIALVITTPSNGTIPTDSASGAPPEAHMLQNTATAIARIRIIPRQVGTYSYAWTATDDGGLVVGTSVGTFEVAPPVPVTMPATVSAAE